jgi:hypothetical protein
VASGGVAKRAAKWGLTAVAATVVLGAIGLVVVLVLTQELTGAQGFPVFEYDDSLAIEKRTVSGVPYRINNSRATFRLDVEFRDAHARRLFCDYASALAYCRANGLPVLPSVHLVQGKCKQFDDGLCAALELAVQDGRAVPGTLGKREALSRLARRLAGALPGLPDDRRDSVEAALVHVAAALELGGGKMGLEGDLARRASSAIDGFDQRPKESKPIGFWERSVALRALFRQDRFLSHGFSLENDAGACVALSWAISRDDALARAFRRFRACDAALTNPPVYVDQETALAPPSPCPSFDELAALLPSAATLAEALAPDMLARLRDRFGKDAGLALVAYAQSKEYDLLLRLHAEGGVGGAEEAMDRIIGAIREGRVILDPKPDSGWYDFQWHALETLLLPGRARESSKLTLSDAYRKRLADAFKVLLTKQRETHIKRLPMLTLGCEMDPESPEPVTVAPEFSAEPTATVYLRLARGYRFLRNALHAILGEKALRGLRRTRADGVEARIDLDAELREAALRLYGICELLAREIGLRPGYLPGEIDEAEREEANGIASRWLDSLEFDPDLAADTRVAVPAALGTDGAFYYWATGGVRLERLEAVYLEKPAVSGNVVETFIPLRAYTPTDVFVGFERKGPPLTREEYRALCDRAGEEAELRAVLGAPPAEGSFPWGTGAVLAAVAAFLAAAVRYGLPGRAWRWLTWKRAWGLAGGGAAVLAVGIVLLLCIPEWRAWFLVKHVASRHMLLGMMVENSPWGLRAVEPRARFRVLIRLLGDGDPQVRYLAARMLYAYAECGMGDVGPGEELDRAEHRALLRTATDDACLETAAHAIRMLGRYGDPADVEPLLAKLERYHHMAGMAHAILDTLARIGDPRALDAVLSLTESGSPAVRRMAIDTLWFYEDRRVARKLVGLLVRRGSPESTWAAGVISHIDYFSQDLSCGTIERDRCGRLMAFIREIASSRGVSDLRERLKEAAEEDRYR